MENGRLVEESEVGGGILENPCEKLVTEVEEKLAQTLLCLLQFSVWAVKWCGNTLQTTLLEGFFELIYQSVAISTLSR